MEHVIAVVEEILTAQDCAAISVRWYRIDQRELIEGSNLHHDKLFTLSKIGDAFLLRVIFKGDELQFQDAVINEETYIQIKELIKRYL